MRRAGILLALILAVSGLGHAQADERGPFKVGVATRSFAPDEPYNWRGARTRALVATIWYPAIAGTTEQPQWIGPTDAPIASAGTAARNAEIAAAPARFPMIMLSHGTGSSALAMSWLGTSLASHGYIAVAVNHPGNNATEDYTAQGFLLWWERASDISTAIDRVLADPVFRERVDPQRIAGAGFSLGGYTMIELAGGITDLSIAEGDCASGDERCKGPPEFPDLPSRRDDLLKTDSEFRASVDRAGQSYRDPRIRAVLVMAPAIGHVLGSEHLRKIAVPVRIVVGDDDRIVFVPPAERLASEIPGAELTIFPGGIGHNTFLPVCTDQGRKVRPALCVDAPGVDRGAIHGKAADIALGFFAANLK